MRNTLSVRLSHGLSEWLEEVSRKTGVPAGRIIREQLEKARRRAGNRQFLRLAGKIAGPRDLSSRKGFSRQ